MTTSTSTPEPSTITFGPLSHPWTYDTTTKTYDLSQSSTSSEKFTIATSQGPPSTSIILNPTETALVIVDMQNFFLSDKCTDHPNGLKAVEPTIAVIEKCRELGIQIIWLNWGLTPSDLLTLPSAVHRSFMRDTLLQTPSQSPSPPPRPRSKTRRPGLGQPLDPPSLGRCLAADSWNAAIYAPLREHKSDSDIQCAKNRMSGLWSPAQPLWQVLEVRAVRNLLFAGVNTDQCVLGTLQDAYNNGWSCVLVDDCCGTTTEGGREVVVHNVASAYGFVTDSSCILNCKVG